MEVLKELNIIQEKYKNDYTPTFGIRISDMAKDAADAIKTLQQENKQLRDALEEAAETIENMYGTETKQTEKYRVLIDEVMKG